jgi:hypothetical protein
MTWAAKRKAAYIIIFALLVFVPVGIFVYVKMQKAPTCFDGIRNQDEHAVDRGGPCVLLDERALTPYAISWARALPVRVPDSDGGGVYNAVAYVENPNTDAWVKRAAYRFRLYDAQNILVGEREGYITLLPQATTPVFEGGIESGTRKATRAFFEFTEPLVWERGAPPYPDLLIGNPVMSSYGTTRVTVKAQNTGSSRYEDIGFVAVLFDTTGNAFAVSKTVRDSFGRKEVAELVFTWPTIFEKVAGRIDVLPVHNTLPL